MTILNMCSSELIEELTKVFGVESEEELNTQLKSLSKIEAMDKWVNSFAGNLDSEGICKIINLLFGFDLKTKTVSSASSSVSSLSVINSYLEAHEFNVTGADIRKMINEMFGINLDAIASLEKARISLFSKNQWMVRHEQDLFVVHTGDNDVDAWVYPTEYFKEHTGKIELPEELQQDLIQLGYTFNDKVGGYYYSNPTGKAVPDAFKGQTMGAIIKVIQKSYLSL
ncbi:hypothetical protein [Heyndrickxia shackletonii]|nr:hypothetical protein [Heyndrickxia shackletonii]